MEKKKEEEPRPAPKTKYKNKHRTLVFGARGITDRGRHLMRDIQDLLPHSKKEAKLDNKRNLKEVNAIADLKNCNNCIFLEPRKHAMYMWISRVPSGPSMRFLVQNSHTMAELKLTGNCIKGARPMLAFDTNFDEIPRLKMMKELMYQTFGSPRGHPKTKPFIDHVFSFFYLDERIWFRNYQIVYDAHPNTKVKQKPVLVEVGPRFVLKPVRFFSGSFAGRTLWQDEDFVPPHVKDVGKKRSKAMVYVNRKRQKRNKEAYDEVNAPPVDELNLNAIFAEEESDEDS